jgi:gluconate 5-dehydrogenase
VVIGSLADINPIPASSVYSASKAALHSLVRAIASEIDPQRYPNVLINEFMPNATRTAMSDHGDEPASLYPRVKRLVDLPAGGRSGAMFFRDKELRLNESPRARLRRAVLGLLGRG